MVERIDNEDKVSRAFKALSDPTRRSILTSLVQEGPMRVGELAARFDMSLNAVSKHIKVLEQNELVRRRTEWREHIIVANLAPLELVSEWIHGLRDNWSVRLEGLAQSLEEEHDNGQ